VAVEPVAELPASPCNLRSQSAAGVAAAALALGQQE